MQLHPTSGNNKVVCMYYEVGVPSSHKMSGYLKSPPKIMLAD